MLTSEPMVDSQDREAALFETKKFLRDNKIQTDSSDNLKPQYTRDGRRIVYKPDYYNTDGVRLKETSRIVRATAFSPIVFPPGFDSYKVKAP